MQSSLGLLVRSAVHRIVARKETGRLVAVRRAVVDEVEWANTVIDELEHKVAMEAVVAAAVDRGSIRHSVEAGPLVEVQGVMSNPLVADNVTIADHTHMVGE